MTDTFALSQELCCPEGNSSSFIQPTIQYNALLVLTLRTKQYYLHIVHTVFDNLRFHILREKYETKAMSQLMTQQKSIFVLLSPRACPISLSSVLTKSQWMNLMEERKEHLSRDYSRFHLSLTPVLFTICMGDYSEAKLSYITSPK